MSSLTVIGIGNRLCGDDGVGNEIVQTLSEQINDNRIQFIIGETDIDYCLSQAQSSHIIIIDAVYANTQPGSICVIDLDKLGTPKISGITMHDQHALTLIRSAKISGFLIGIEPYDISLHLGVSEIIKSQYDNIINSIKELIMKYTEKISV